MLPIAPATSLAPDLPMKLIQAATLPCALFLLPSCIFSAGSRQPRSWDSGEEQAADGARDGDESERAHLAIEIAQLAAAADLAEAELEKAAARRDLTSARQDLEVFLNLERPLKLAEQELALTEARGQLISAEVELAELEEMYAVHPADPKTAELVLARARRAVEEYGQGLAVEEQRLDHLIDGELPGEERGYREAVDEAEAGLEAARWALKLARQQTELDLLDAWEESGLVREDAAAGGGEDE